MTANEQKTVIDEKHSMPSILVEIMDVLKDLHPNASYNCKLNILLAKTAQLIGFKRVKLQEYEHSTCKISNHYAINFMSSGAGKDRIASDMDLYIFKNFIEYFKQKAKDYKQEQEVVIEQEAMENFSGDKQKTRRSDYIRNEKEKLRDLDIEINLATPEGFFSDAEVLKKAGFGSLFVKLSEFGVFIQKGRQEDYLFLNCLFDAYDGKISSKSTKYDKRKASIEDMPVNILLHSDPTAFKTDIQKYFTQLMQIGLARRAFVSFQVSEKNLIEFDPQKAKIIQEQAYGKAKSINERLFNLFMKIPSNAVYKLSNGAFENVFHPYKVKTTELYNQNEDDEMIGKEILSREFKSLKLACIYACLNHPEDPIINENDFIQAITTVEKLSIDLKKFLAYDPEGKDLNERLFHFLLARLDTPFKKTELVNASRQFHVRSAELRKNYDKFIKEVSKMALDNGYYLRKELINNNSGIEVTLTKQTEPKGFGIEDL